jgi:predicted TIM-barrel fold metal-dependent hydrolase
MAEASIEQMSAGFRAYNRWLAEFRSATPERWIGMAAISFHDIEAAIEEIRAAKDLGFGGIAIPAVPDTDRIYQAEYDPIWGVMQDLELVANIHVAIANRIPTYLDAPSLTAGRALVGADIFTGARNLLPSLIFGGVMERYPKLKFVFTETHSDWVRGALLRMNHAYDRSDLKRDIQDVIPQRPGEYWQRQCYIGSSIFSRAEVAARESIGVDKMMMGMDFPHSEGAWRHGTLNYLQATFGAEHVPEADARRMLHGNAASVYGFDLRALDRISSQVGLRRGCGADRADRPAEPAWRSQPPAHPSLTDRKPAGSRQRRPEQFQFSRFIRAVQPTSSRQGVASGPLRRKRQRPP